MRDLRGGLEVGRKGDGVVRSQEPDGLGQPNSVGLQARRSTRQLVQRPLISRTLWLDPSLAVCCGQGPLNNAALTGGCRNSVQHEVSAVPGTRPLHRKCSDTAVNNSA